MIELKVFCSFELPVIILIARSRPEDVSEGLSCSANDYLVKPVFRKELLARVHNHLEQKQAVDHLKGNSNYSAS